MNSGSAASTSSSLYANWLPSGVWQGLFSGSYYDDLDYQDDGGDYWSSTASNTDDAYFLYFNDGLVYPGYYYYGLKFGYAVRCAI